MASTRFKFGSAGTTACESEGERPWDRAGAGDCGGSGKARTGLPPGSAADGEKRERCHSRGAGGGKSLRHSRR